MRLGSAPRGVVLYVRPPGTDRLETVRFDCARTALVEGNAGGVDPNAWLVARLRELVGQRRTAGRPVASCPRMPIEVATERGVAIAGDERAVTVSAGPKHASVHAGTVKAVTLVKPAVEKDETPPLRRVIVQLKPGCVDAEVLVDLDDSEEEDRALEWFLLNQARFDV